MSPRTRPYKFRYMDSHNESTLVTKVLVIQTFLKISWPSFNHCMYWIPDRNVWNENTLWYLWNASRLLLNFVWNRGNWSKSGRRPRTRPGANTMNVLRKNIYFLRKRKYVPTFFLMWPLREVFITSILQVYYICF